MATAMAIPLFNEQELKVESIIPESILRPELKNFSYPVTCKEAQHASLEKHPYWQIIGVESQIFTPRILPDNISRGFVFENTPFDPAAQGGGKDMFGVEWIYDPEAGGSMVRPGTPLFDDANEWKETLVWPDIGTWDWEGSAQENNDTYLDTDLYNVAWIQTGWFERLISYMNFENAIVAIIDENQQDAVTELLGKITDLYISMIDKFIEHFPAIDGFYIHDDWGSAQNTFFSPEVAQKMIVPHMRRVTDHLHSKGLTAELHSCGNNIKQVPNYIAAGWDAWSPQGNVNDTQKIYELYGDRILIGVLPDPLDREASDGEQYAAACAYADRFCKPDKPSFLNVEAGNMLTSSFREGLYVQSRKNYSA